MLSHTALETATRRRGTLQASEQQPSDDPQPPTEEQASWREVGDPLLRTPSDRFVTTGRSKSRAAGRPSRRTVSLETTPPRRSRHPQAPPSLVQELDRVFTQRPRAGGLQLQNDALNRESDARRRRRHFTRMNLARAFARSAGTITARVHRLKPAPSLRPPQPRDATVIVPQNPLPKLQLPPPSSQPGNAPAPHRTTAPPRLHLAQKDAHGAALACRHWMMPA